MRSRFLACASIIDVTYTVWNVNVFGGVGERNFADEKDRERERERRAIPTKSWLSLRIKILRDPFAQQNTEQQKHQPIPSTTLSSSFYSKPTRSCTHLISCDPNITGEWVEAYACAVTILWLVMNLLVTTNP